MHSCSLLGRERAGASDAISCSLHCMHPLMQDEVKDPSHTKCLHALQVTSVSGSLRQLGLQLLCELLTSTQSFLELQQLLSLSALLAAQPTLLSLMISLQLACILIPFCQLRLQLPDFLLVMLKQCSHIS